MVLEKSLLSHFQEVGRDMYLTGLVSSHAGTLSTADGESDRISKRNAMLGRLAAKDFLELSPEGEPSEDAPEDVLIHRAIYRVTGAKAVIHARPPATMALALFAADNKGLSTTISQRQLGSTEVADLMGQMLKDTRVAVLRGRGVFAWGDDLDQALHMISLLDEMCQVAQIYRTLTREEEQPVLPERFDQRQGNLSPFRQGRDGNQRQQMHRGNQRRPGGPPRQGGGGGTGPHRPPRGNPGGGGGMPGSFRP